MPPGLYTKEKNAVEVVIWWNVGVDVDVNVNDAVYGGSALLHKKSHLVNLAQSSKTDTFRRKCSRHHSSELV